jgi:hypothetical protein
MNALLRSSAIALLAASMGLAEPASAKPSLGRFEVQANAGLVVDTATKLTWERSVTLGSYGWAAAKGYCSGLSLAGGGWRLPTLSEIEGLVDRRTGNPAIDPTAFPNTPAVAFWSSTVYVGTPDNAWRVSFDDGHASTGKTLEVLRVRCVR